MRSFTPQAKPARRLIARAEMLDHSDLRQLIGDEEQMRKHRHVIVAQPMEDFDRHFDFESARNERNVPDETKALCNAANLAEPSFASVDMKYFRKRSACSTMARSSG